MTEKENFVYLNTVFCCELLADYMDQLKSTPVYKANIKVNAMQLSNQINRVLHTELPKVFQMDETMTINIMNQFKSLVNSVSDLEPQDLVIISQIIQAYKENREYWLNKHEIVFKELNQG